MYINPFVAGILTTISLELVAIVGFIFYCAMSEVNKKGKK